MLIITGDNVSAHKWQETSKAVKDLLEKDGADQGRHYRDAVERPDRRQPGQVRRLAAQLQGDADGPPESRWSDSNKQAFLKAVREGKGLVAYHFASSAFTKPNWDEFEKAVAGGWRTQGFHGPAHVFTVKKTDAKHPISDGMPARIHACNRRAVSKLDDDAGQRRAGDGLLGPQQAAGNRQG